MGKVTTRPVDVSKKNQAFLNAVASIIVPVTDFDGVILNAPATGTLTTDIEIENKPCVILTAKHVACGKNIATDSSGGRYVQISNDAECTDPNRTLEVKIGKTKDPKGNGFDFKVRAQIVDVGSFADYGDRGDWAVLKIVGKTPKQPNFPKPIPSVFADIGNDYTGLQVVSAGYPGYGGSSKLYADWNCKSRMATFSMASTNCEIDNGFSGGPLLANLDDFGVVQVGVNTSGGYSFDGKRSVQSSGDVVSFELKNTDYEVDVTEATIIREAMKKITCD